MADATARTARQLDELLAQRLSPLISNVSKLLDLNQKLDVVVKSVEMYSPSHDQFHTPPIDPANVSTQSSRLLHFLSMLCATCPGRWTQMIMNFREQDVSIAV